MSRLTWLRGFGQEEHFEMLNFRTTLEIKMFECQNKFTGMMLMIDIQLSRIRQTTRV